MARIAPTSKLTNKSKRFLSIMLDYQIRRKTIDKNLAEISRMMKEPTTKPPKEKEHVDGWFSRHTPSWLSKFKTNFIKLFDTSHS